MSLSDYENGKREDPGLEEDGFRPMDVRTLDRFEHEVTLKTPETSPDFERFKMLFDPSELPSGEPAAFEALYTFVRDEGAPFIPLIKGAGDEVFTGDPKKKAIEPQDLLVQEVIVEKTPEEIGFEQGFAKGLAQGMAEGRAQGEAQGFAQGFAKGEAEGLAQGEAKGFAQGEAQGVEKGYAEGRSKAEDAVKEETQKILGPLKESLETVDQLLERLVKRYEVQIMELVHKIAQKAVQAKLDMDDETVRQTILDALKSLVAPEEIALSVSAEDYEYVEMIKDEFFASVRSLKHVAVASDPLIPRGGCRIETATGTITTDPETKLSAIYDALVQAGKF